MDKIVIVDGKKYEKIEEYEKNSCLCCVFYGEVADCDSSICRAEGVILIEIEGENYE